MVQETQQENQPRTKEDVRPFIFGTEKVADITKEVIPLLFAHWKEIAHYDDIKLEPDWESYRALNEAGILKVFTVRTTNARVLIGYSVFFVKNNLHYKSSKQAVQDILFIHKDYRGTGRHFIRWCDQQLKADGIQVVYHHVKKAHNFGPLLERMDYELVDLIYAKRLDQ